MFYDRKDAALYLAKALAEYKDQGAVVLGIPRGGVETAYYVAKYLHAELSLIISRKLGHPGNPEYAMGALAEDGSVHMNERALREVSQEDIDAAIEGQKIEIERRIRMLRKGEPLPDMKNKIVLIVDDGIATGSTIMAAIEMCRKKQAAKIVIAAPVCGYEVKSELMKMADDVVILETPEFYHAVSQVYASFEQVSDEEALWLMDMWKKEKRPIVKASGL
ncbi:MAG TPA: phosphoribosyltransferase family protein [Chitinophagaceae bacterium]|nr:phosphoribosyltransferase family protein [Chitinophagaceae bacterium]